MECWEGEQTGSETEAAGQMRSRRRGGSEEVGTAGHFSLFSLLFHPNRM
ncbi:hypothetical protein EYF80_067980 [Liparis tanakae]|uniref:Uncharacterized protein n=1 Tax=Liparis tanakae TaxID=230148 RepID=A0A4Z2DZL6_9TELE|nr:hypothetical protein EYF80_067980 [Liparis tanakae]